MARLTRDESRERTRDQLLEAARLAVARKGYDGASVADIAEAAGYSKGAFFSNFESKEALLLELLRRHKEQDLANLEQALGAVEPDHAAASALDGYFKTLGNSADWCRLDIELQLQAARNPAFSAGYDALQRQTRSSLAGLIAAQFTKAGKRPPIAPDGLAELFMGLVNGLVLQRSNEPGATIRLVFESLMVTAEQA